jgi:hypothetical protein
MNSAAPTKIFGIRLGLDPKIIVVLLIAVAALLFWYNSRSDEEPSAPATVSRSERNAAPPGAEISSAPTAAGRPPVRGSSAARRSSTNADRATTLRMRPIDPTHGDIDPTLRLDLLVRLQSIKPTENSRNLFQMGAAPLTDALGNPIQHPIIPPKPVPPTVPSPQPPVEAEVNIPLKYYGFAKPVGQAEYNRGFFLDGDIILVAYEGEVLKQKYVVVELTPTSARIEDTELKKGKTLPLEPQAKEEF